MTAVQIGEVSTSTTELATLVRRSDSIQKTKCKDNAIPAIRVRKSSFFLSKSYNTVFCFRDIPVNIRAAIESLYVAMIKDGTSSAHRIKIEAVDMEINPTEIIRKALLFCDIFMIKNVMESIEAAASMQAVYSDRIDNNRIKTPNYLNFQLIYFK